MSKQWIFTARHAYKNNKDCYFRKSKARGWLVNFHPIYKKDRFYRKFVKSVFYIDTPRDVDKEVDTYSDAESEEYEEEPVEPEYKQEPEYVHEEVIFPGDYLYIDRMGDREDEESSEYEYEKYTLKYISKDDLDDAYEAYEKDKKKYLGY